MPTPTPLTTPELLTLIFTHLDTRTLLLSQRVNRTWLTLIQTSPILQEALFFRPSTTNPNPTANNDTDTNIEIKYNPLLLTHFASFFPCITDPSQINTSDPPSPLSNLTLLTHDDKRLAYLRPQASWRKMLTLQPRKKTKEEQEFVRMGFLFDLIVFRYHHTNISLIWGRQIPERLKKAHSEVMEGIFSRAHEDADLVVYKYQMHTCCVPGYDAERAAEEWKRSPKYKIHKVYEELGLQMTWFAYETFVSPCKRVEEEDELECWPEFRSGLFGGLTEEDVSL
ncbi:hypothetical protein BO78DRAFT_384341 [Aspergillus sclerotiicarbonarius CBS 121057]|uniref:F-box domain-containing protein n=1 Tax=Aspergillus sclerotiicarbonarius (strain CBS 121057 / IBT 28362) TaxID=1448318 RepID=A0A319EGN4_ASPSB|nr:hypothetical protein BO78DRAFT_384341 [Aspergillus sclerotiicarbonarius CBS 121057]